jgi:hypothetical protein
MDGKNLEIAIVTGADLSFKWGEQYSLAHSAPVSFGAADNLQRRVRTASLDL